MAREDIVIAWLNDANAMETALIQVLEHRVKDSKDYPTVQAKDQQHLEQTRRHADLVKGCVERLGGSTSSVKTALAGMFGAVQAPMTGTAKDEMVKNALTDYAAECFEVASYTALIAAAMDLGDTQTADVCRQILTEDQAMAAWIGENLPMLVREQMEQMARQAAPA